ncbi:MAG: ATP adenylyltransferase [Phormidesmis priestleyi Ana]|uniref:ATP adenylyltransferase n=1 Tax=Phormidesmis priestleyi Ana TaxID=1666911 RepID=A0A0P7ZWV4_9CYAN|nr:MAG: ATP adenylyltransferase [Phormidesmis priestleyi Ana]
MKKIEWETGTLWKRLKEQTAHGLSVGALQPIETTVEQVDDGSIPFSIHIVDSLSLKEEAKAQQAKTEFENPFLPYEEDLYVTDISPTHVCLLNKFNVIDHHFLIVTREFEEQDSWLTSADFEAVVRCLSEVDGLAFFNGGTIAGSSQRHKHLQVVPRTEEKPEFPVEQAILKAKVSGGGRRSPLFAFQHEIANFPPQKQGFSDKVLTTLYANRYQMLLKAVGIDPTEAEAKQAAPYNMLCTRKWMMLVPRSQEDYMGIPVNALGFAGSLLVKNQSELVKLQELGPMNLLEQVAISSRE